MAVSPLQLHTLEDYPAHSNFCEIALVSMGHQDVFVHVGDQVRIQAPNGRWVAPIVTGSFGSSDFIHSLLGGTHIYKMSLKRVSDPILSMQRPVIISCVNFFFVCQV